MIIQLSAEEPQENVLPEDHSMTKIKMLRLMIRHQDKNIEMGLTKRVENAKFKADATYLPAVRSN